MENEQETSQEGVVGDYITTGRNSPLAQKSIVLNETAVRIATKLIKSNEGCCLRAYPDPDSDLSKALATHNKLQAYKDGKFGIPEEWKYLSGKPWTIGFGATEGVKEGDVWSQERAESDLNNRVRGKMLLVLKASPKLLGQSAERIAACTSLADNIGLSAYSGSTVDKMIDCSDWQKAADAFRSWRMDNGHIVQGLVARREVERNLFLSV